MGSAVAGDRPFRTPPAPWSSGIRGTLDSTPPYAPRLLLRPPKRRGRSSHPVRRDHPGDEGSHLSSCECLSRRDDRHPGVVARERFGGARRVGWLREEHRTGFAKEPTSQSTKPQGPPVFGLIREGPRATYLPSCS